MLYNIAEGWCQNVFEMGPSQDLKSLGGRDFSTLKMLLVPEGFRVTLISEKEETQLGPIYGRMVVDKFCEENWDSILVKKVESFDGVTAAQLPLLCEEVGYGGYCQQLGDEFKNKVAKLNSVKGKFKGMHFLTFNIHHFHIHLNCVIFLL